jgi:hypothetical protein
MKQLANMVSGYQAIIGSPQTHLLMLICAAMFASPPTTVFETTVDDTHKEWHSYSSKIQSLIIASHALGAIYGVILIISQYKNVPSWLKRTASSFILVTMLVYLVMIVMIADLLMAHDQLGDFTDEFKVYKRWLIVEVTVFNANICGMVVYTFFCYVFNTSDITLQFGED